MPAGLRLVLEVARHERPARGQLIDDVPAQRIVFEQPGAGTLRPIAVAGQIAAHERAVNRIIFGQHDRGGVRPVLEQRALVEQQVVQVGQRVGANPAEHDELVAARHRADRVELQAADLPDDVEHPRGISRAALVVQPLAANRQPSG